VVVIASQIGLAAQVSDGASEPKLVRLTSTLKHFKFGAYKHVQQSLQQSKIP